ncbi:MAG: hypothetical protein LBB62_10210 [Proteiniphilum sp.]|jgi:hypothetical protein|nr:hypothetical protein [Proteiniphilum sp.]
MNKAKLFFTMLLLFAVVQSWGQKHVFRPEPNFNSQPDTISEYSNFEVEHHQNYKILEYVGSDWVKVQRSKFVRKHDKTGKYLGGRYENVAEYIDIESFNPYVIKEEREIHLRSQPDINSPVVLSIEATMMGILGMAGYLETHGALPENDKRNETHDITRTHYNIIGSTKAEWIQFCAVIDMLPHTKSYDELTDKERDEYVQNLKNIKSTEYTIYGYVDRREFESNMELQPVYVPSIKERISDFMSNISNDIEDFFEYRMNLKEDFHIWILVLLALNLIVLTAMGSWPKVQFILDYGSLLSVFILEVVYIVLLESKFWWCSPDQVGWIKAILFFLLTLALSVYQFFRFFHMLDQIKEKSKPFNTFIGITLFTVIAIVMFIYAIFAGGLDDDQNQLLINILIGTQILQVIITTIQLRKYPLYALMMLLLIPLGTFAILLSFLRLFVFLCFFGLLAFVFYCWATSVSPEKAGNGEGGGNWGMAQGCPHRNGAYCTFITGHNNNCNLLKGGEYCQHGQR